MAPSGDAVLSPRLPPGHQRGVQRTWLPALIRESAAGQWVSGPDTPRPATQHLAAPASPRSASRHAPRPTTPAARTAPRADPNGPASQTAVTSPASPSASALRRFGALIILASQLRINGHPVTEHDLRGEGAIAVNYFVRADVTGLREADIEALVQPGDGRRVKPPSYARQLHMFANAPAGTPIVTRCSGNRGRRPYLTGRLEGEYQYAPDRFDGHPHMRRVSWGDHLSEGTTLDGRRYTTVRTPIDPRLIDLIAQASR
jgi:hypothetical protein